MTYSTPAEIFQTSAQQAALLRAERNAGRPLLATLQLPASVVGDNAQWHAALLQLAERHEILRTRYTQVPGLQLPAQAISAQAEVRLMHAADLEQARELARAVLAETPLVAVRWAEQVLLAAPLASLDRTSLRLLADELAALGQGQTLPEFDALQYADYAAWQEELAEQQLGQEGLAHWRGLLAQFIQAPQLPFERRVGLGGERESSRLELPLATVAGLAAQLGLPAQVALGGLWAGFLGGLVGEQRVLLSLLVDGRNEQLLATFGHFARRLPVAAEVPAQQSVREHLQGFAQQLAQSRSWLECFNEVELFESNLGQPGPLLLGADIELETEHDLALVQDPAQAEKLHLQARRCGQQLILQLLAPVGLLAPGLLDAWLAQFAVFIAGAAAAPEHSVSDIATLDAGQSQQVLASLDRSASLQRPQAQLLHQLFERRAALHPQHIALQVEGRQLSYAELDRQANRLARRLQAEGVGRDALVGVYGGRSVEIVVTLLAILKAGGAYLPLDPSYPHERLSFMLEDAGVRCLVRLQALPEELTLPAATVQLEVTAQTLKEGDASPLPASNHSDDLAYVIYTSGSTGLPKGVMISHANACASTQARLQFYREPIQRFLMLSSFSFDSSVAGIFWTLAQGGSLCLPAEQAHKDPLQIAQQVADQQISHFLALPSFYAQILEALPTDAGLACVIVAGEACPIELSERHQHRLPQTLLVNEYGPSESAVWCTAQAVAEPVLAERVAIGTAIAGTRLQVLDEQGELVGFGRPGELYIAGAGLARGYLARPSLTASRFLPDPHGAVPGARLYRTGDRVACRPDGVLDYLGRLDFQLKIRGFRIELGEIEARLGADSRVREAAVVARDTAAGKQLAAYVVLHADAPAEASEAALLELLREQLPEHMVPAFINALERMPLTPNGKLDRNALSAREQRGQAYVAPRNELEQTLARIWQEALELPQVGIHDNFFALGGHSLLATRIRSRVHSELNINLPLRAFFEGETVELLAQQVELHRDNEVNEDKLDALEALFAEAEQQ